MKHPRVFGLLLLFFMLASAAVAVAQQQSPPQKQPSPQAQPPQKPADPPAKAPAGDTASALLTSARNVMITRDRGSQISYDVISSTIDGWERFTMVDKTDKADLVITIGTTGGDSGVRVSGGENTAGGGVSYSNAEITLTVYDAKTKRMLWTGVQTAKSAMKQTARENNLVEAAEKLAKKFHDRLEPPPKPPDD